MIDGFDWICYGYLSAKVQDDWSVFSFLDYLFFDGHKLLFGKRAEKGLILVNTFIGLYSPSVTFFQEEIANSASCFTGG